MEISTEAISSRSYAERDKNTFIWTIVFCKRTPENQKNDVESKSKRVYYFRLAYLFPQFYVCP